MSEMDPFESWKKEAKFFKYRDHPIAYWTAGKGPALVLIHGFPTASWDWHKIWDQLAERFTIYACDMIGFGYSAKPNNYDYRLTDQARLHDAFIEFLGIDALHLLVHDYGVSVAQELLAAQQDSVPNSPYRILSCSFLNGGLFPELHKARFIQKIINSPVGFIVGKFLSKKNLRKSFDEIYGNLKPTDQEIDQFYHLMENQNGIRNIHKLMRYINDRKTNAQRWKNALINSDIPMQLINGPLDPVSGRHLATYFKELLPHTPVTILEGVGHYPHDEAPNEVLEAYLEFVTPLL